MVCIRLQCSIQNVGVPKKGTKFLFTLLFDHPDSCHFHQVWYAAVPSRIRTFNCVVSLDRQNTVGILQRIHPYMTLCPAVCCLCGKHKETKNHMFIHCKFASKVWSYFLYSLFMAFVMPQLIHDTFW